MPLVLGVDIGTSSTKGVLVRHDGTLVSHRVVYHDVSQPSPGCFEMNGTVWWQEFLDVASALVKEADEPIESVGVSGMGPCVLLTDASGTPLRPAILYGIDTRAADEIRELDDLLGRDEIYSRCGSYLSTQAVGPKLRWLSKHDAAVFAAAERLFMPASWLAYNLTGSYALDHHSASQCTPMYDVGQLGWCDTFCLPILPPKLQLPPLLWPNEIVGRVTADAAAATGLPVGVPVTIGSIDAWTEAVSVGADRPGDLFLMYGSTFFFVATAAARLSAPALWGTVGARRGTWSLAAGMATSGSVSAWWRKMFGDVSFSELTSGACAAPVGANGLITLPYFAGERTPIADPAARGVILGLTLQHSRGDLFRSALEATAFAVRHNVDAIRAAGAEIRRIVIAGGGVEGGFWPQVVSDVTGLEQMVPSVTIGASYGAAKLAAEGIGLDVHGWNTEGNTVKPVTARKAAYDRLYALYLKAYPATQDICHELAAIQAGTAA